MLNGHSAHTPAYAFGESEYALAKLIYCEPKWIEIFFLRVNRSTLAACKYMDGGNGAARPIGDIQRAEFVPRSQNGYSKAMM